MMSASPDGPLAAREVYGLWAPTYDAENPVTTLDDLAVRTLSPDLDGCSLLDAGCGTGRRLTRVAAGGPRRAVGIDFVVSMLTVGHARHPGTSLAAADLRVLPFPPATFDRIWCRLAIGHVADLGPAYREFARVAATGARLVITDFHPDAVAAGHTRGFRDAAGRSHVVAHRVHGPSDHARAAERTGWTLERRLDLTVGPPVRRFYADAGLLDSYDRQLGLPLVLALSFVH